MLPLSRHAGSWAGTNTFKLMPTDEPYGAQATANVALAASGNLVTIAYTWGHPDDGVQDGLFVAGPGEGPGSVVAFWGDSWHQKDAAQVLLGAIDGSVMTVICTYGGDWQWQIVVDASEADALAVRMDNIVPASVAGGEAPTAYAAMSSELRRG